MEQLIHVAMQHAPQVTARLRPQAGVSTEMLPVRAEIVRALSAAKTRVNR
jgi:hypothetical protein